MVDKALAKLQSKVRTNATGQTHAYMQCFVKEGTNSTPQRLWDLTWMDEVSIEY